MSRRSLRDLTRSLRPQQAPTPKESPAAAGNPDLATAADIEAAFRLLLGRPPDPDGAAYWQAKLGLLTVESLASSVMDSREFRSGPLCRHLLETGPSSAPQARPAELVEAQGLKFWVDPTDYISRRIIDAGIYEAHVTTPLTSALSEGATFVDVGANIGWHTMLAAQRVGPKGRVLSFEPDPYNIDLLLRSAWTNHFENVVGLPLALSDDYGTAVMQRLGGSDAAMFAADDKVGIGDHRVSCLPLDNFESWVDRLDVLKVDVEGADFLVLQGGERLIGRYRPVIFFEFGPDGMARFDDSTPARLGDWLRRHRYAIDVLHRDAPVTREPDIEAVMAILDGEGLKFLDLRLVPEAG